MFNTYMYPTDQMFGFSFSHVRCEKKENDYKSYETNKWVYMTREVFKSPQILSN